MEAFRYFIGGIILIAVIVGSSCADFEHTFRQAEQAPDGTRFTASGIFDLKVICLNAGPKNVVEGDHCSGYFSESGEPGASAAEIELRICTENLQASCIERLPESAPPEVIIIRNVLGQPIDRWRTNRVVFQKTGSGKTASFEVLEIY